MAQFIRLLGGGRPGHNCMANCIGLGSTVVCWSRGGEREREREAENVHMIRTR